MPIFQANCGTSGAIRHGSPTVSIPTAMQPRPFLDDAFGTPDPATLATIYDGIVNTASNEDMITLELTPRARLTAPSLRRTRADRLLLVAPRSRGALREDQRDDQPRPSRWPSSG